MSESIPLCRSEELQERGDAVSFDLLYAGQASRAFAVRYAGRVHAYLNRCSHVPIEMDAMPNRFFDLSGTLLICSTHGAVYRPDSGHCAGGPCRGGLYKITLSEADGMVHWHTGPHLKPIEF